MKPSFLLAVAIITLFFKIPVFAQFRCGADEVRAKLIASDPTYLKSMEKINAGINSYIKAHPPMLNDVARGAAAAQYIIPCVVHVIYDGDPTIGSAYNPSAAQITGAIDYINKVYDGTWTGTGGAITGAGDLQIQLALATKDPDNNATSGINRVNGAGIAGYSASGVNSISSTGASEISVKNASRWDPERYYNIWIVNKIDGCTGTFCNSCTACNVSYIAGYAYMPQPNNTSLNSMNLDGTIMVASQMIAGQKTLPHEIGHAFNLSHPFEGSSSSTCPANADGTVDGDMCVDTDPITNPQFDVNPFSCRTGTNPCTNTNFNDNTEKNYMNYTECYTLFTNNQKARMQASAVITQRASLATSWANNQAVYPAAFVAPGAGPSAPNSLFTGNNIAGILNISLNGQTIYSLNATQDGGYLDNSAKWYDAMQMNTATTYTLNVTLLDNTNNSQLGVWIDLNNDGIFNNLNEKIFLNTNITNNGTGTLTVPVTFTTPASWIGGNNFVRIRLINDLSTIYGVAAISNTSTSLKYGQAEDYPIYLHGGTLPVKLTSFTGVKTTNAIQLSWATTQELNAKNYLVERSLKAAAYTTIGTVKATGAANGANYNFNDADITTSGNYLYRLKMMDLDGKFAYSNIVNFSIAPKKELIVAGTIFNDKIIITMPYSSGKASFRISDAAGRIVYNTSRNLEDSFTQTLSLQNTNLAKGIYILEVNINGENFTKKLVKN